MEYFPLRLLMAVTINSRQTTVPIYIQLPGLYTMNVNPLSSFLPEEKGQSIMRFTVSNFIP
jgi:hypothetical protein